MDFCNFNCIWNFDYVLTRFINGEYKYSCNSCKNRFVVFVWQNELFLCSVGTVLAIAFGVISAISFYDIADIQMKAFGLRESNKQRYNALIYKAQTESIRDEFGIVNKEYVDEIQEWNEELVKYKAYSENPWISIFYPAEVYEGLETINLEEIKMKD